jgi:hypothetical protein
MDYSMAIEGLQWHDRQAKPPAAAGASTSQ